MYYVKIALRSASSYFWFSFQRNSRFRQPLKGENVKYSDISRLSFTIFESNRKLKVPSLRLNNDRVWKVKF